MKKANRIQLTGVVMAVLATAGCSTMAPPNDQMKEARSSISQAESAGANRHAREALQRANEKLTRAEAAFQNEDFESAKRLAEQADADARYAGITAKTNRIKTELKSVREGIKALQAELTKQS